MTDERNYTQFELLRNALETLLRQWFKLVTAEEKPEEIRLAARTLDAYIRELAELKQAGIGGVLLPANFEIYAFCVEAIFADLVQYKPKRPGTIYISTILKMSLRRWYNISAERDTEGNICEFTRARWEKYKTAVANLRIDPDNPAHSIQMRRIVLKSDDNSRDRNLFKYQPSSDIASHVQDAKNVSIPPCMTLLPEIQSTIESGGLDRLVHLIAEHKPAADARCTHVQWMTIREHLERKYHNGVHGPARTVAKEKKGVFCAYTEAANPFPDYVDVFTVDMISIGGGMFGIGYHIDPQRELGGIVFFNDEQVKEYVGSMDKLWLDAGKSQLPQ